MKMGLCLTPYWRSRGKGAVGTRRREWACTPAETSPGPPLAWTEEMPEGARLCTRQHSCVTRVILVTLSSSITLEKEVRFPNIKQDNRCDGGCGDVSRASWPSEWLKWVSLAPGQGWAIPRSRATHRDAQMGPFLPRSWVPPAPSPAMLPKGLSLRAAPQGRPRPHHPCIKAGPLLLQVPCGVGAHAGPLQWPQGNAATSLSCLSLHVVQRPCGSCPCSSVHRRLSDNGSQRNPMLSPNAVSTMTLTLTPDLASTPTSWPGLAHLGAGVAALAPQLLLKPSRPP